MRTSSLSPPRPLVLVAVLAWVLLAIGLVPPAPAADLAGRITGRVTDASSGEPLVGANVFIEGTTIGTTTDADGRYTIQAAPSGPQTVVASYISYDRGTREVVVPDGETIDVDFELRWEGMQGEEVVITAQAEGQVAAINQQLASNTISNIVSGDRIKELPDVNAAESIGRLPGISIQRSGGEATKVAIRGLSPKYATVTVNGVRLPSSGGDERDVDLSLISSNMLDGIEVKKAITPDMDADAVAGSVDLRLRNAPDGLLVDVMGQGGYNDLQDYYGNYKFAGTVSNRFLDSRLGFIGTFNIDRYDRSADKFSGAYRQASNAVTGDQEIIISSLDLREELVDRGRVGASGLFDYRITGGSISGNAFFNQLTNDGLYRVNSMSVQNNRHFYNLTSGENTTSILTAALNAEQDFNWFQYDVGVSRTFSRSESPQDYYWSFVQENSAFNFGDYQIGPATAPTDLLPYVTSDSTDTGLADLYYQDLVREEDQMALQLNFTVPYRLGDSVTGFVKTGGKLRWLDRFNDEGQSGRGGLQYGGTTSGNVNEFITCADERLPGGFNGFDLYDAAAQYGLLPISVFDDGYAREDFLTGDYPIGYTADPDFARAFSEALYECGYFRENVNASRGRDYSGEERYQAAYVMTEMKLGQRITFIPGIRWEADHSDYTGQRYREVVLNNQQGAPTDLDTLRAVRDFSFLLPMAHLQVRPNDWLTFRLAYTETLSRPGFIQYAPISRIDSQQQYAFAGNSALEPSQSTNLDAAMSIYQNRIGLFTAAAFHKSIRDHIIWVRTYSRWDSETQSTNLLPGLNIPDGWIVNERTGQPINPIVDTYINNPEEATYRGFELDWQTNLWYLPSVLKGIVLNLNYTRILSDTAYRGYYQERVCTNCVAGEPPPRRPQYQTLSFDTLRTGRMVDQPAHIANVTLGYDYKGFSGRLSYLYQTDRVTSVNANTPVLDTFSGTYSRFDLMLRQKVFQGFEIYTNFNNLNNRADRNFQGSPTGSPTYIEYYGFSMDVGARYRF